MAIVGTYMTGWGSAGAGFVTVNSSGQTMPSNTLFLACSLTRAAIGNVSNITISSPNLTWTRAGSPQDLGTVTPTRRIEIWYAKTTIPLAGEVMSMAIDNVTSQTEYGCELIRMAGISMATPIVLTNLVQGDSGITSGTSFTLTYPNAFASTANGCFVHFGSMAGTSSALITPRTNWTELREFGDTNDHHEEQYRPAPDTDASFSQTASGINAGIALELSADTLQPITTTGTLMRPAKRIFGLSFVVVNNFSYFLIPVPPQFHTPGVLIRRIRRIY